MTLTFVMMCLIPATLSCSEKFMVGILLIRRSIDFRTLNTISAKEKRRSDCHCAASWK